MDSTHAHRIYWPGKNSISVERNVKFVSPTVIISTSPTSYASTMAPPQTLPVPVSAPPSPPPPAPPLPPALPPHPSSAPGAVFYPPPQPTAPPPTPTTGIRVLDKDESKVKQTITPRRIAVLTVPSASPSEPHHSSRTTHIPGQYRHLAPEHTDHTQQLYFVVCAHYDDLISQAMSA